MKLWRIAAATRDYAADDLSGGGAARFPGRWNSQTEPVIYCAPTRAVAVLETAAHIEDSAFPHNRYLVGIEVPDDVWSQREEVPVNRDTAGNLGRHSGRSGEHTIRFDLVIVSAITHPVGTLGHRARGMVFTDQSSAFTLFANQHAGHPPFRI